MYMDGSGSAAFKYLPDQLNLSGELNLYRCVRGGPLDGRRRSNAKDAEIRGGALMQNTQRYYFPFLLHPLLLTPNFPAC